MAGAVDEKAGPDLDAGFSGLDDLIDRAFDGSAGAEDEDADPEAEDAPDSDLAGQPEGDRDEEDEDDEEEEGDEDEAYDEDEEDEEDEEEDDEEEEDEEEEEEDEEKLVLSVSPSELKRIKADPALSKLHSSMVRDYTSKTMVLAERTREIDATERAVNDFKQSVSTPEGLASYLSGVMERNSAVVGHAFEAVATGDKGKDFLVAIGEAFPEMFEEAYERFHEIVDDEDERKRYLRERELISKEAELQQREEAQRRRTFDKDFARLITAAEGEAQRMGMEEDDMETVYDRLKAKIRGQVKRDGSISVGVKDAKAAAREAKAEMDRQYEKALRAVNRKKSKESREATKKKARTSKTKRVPPKGTRRKEPKERTKFVPEENKDELDSFIDHRFANL